MSQRVGGSAQVQLATSSNYSGTYANGVFIAVGSIAGGPGTPAIARSTDGINWSLPSTYYSASMTGVAYGNGAPNLSVDFPAIHELAKQKGLPICGKDFKTGQTLMKTILAPGFKARMLGLAGWYSTNRRDRNTRTVKNTAKSAKPATRLSNVRQLQRQMESQSQA